MIVDDNRGIRIIDAESIRASVTFEDLVEPVSRAFEESSAGLADNGLIVMFPAQRRELGDVYVKTGS
jgi:ornithine cyclodeaminase